MDTIKIKAWGLFRLTKQQFLILELFVLLFFISLTIFLFNFEFPVYTDDPVIEFHAKYSKYFSLVCCFLVIIEAQFFLSKFIKAQVIQIEKQKVEIATQKEAITDSIHYARRIQNALLPPEDELQQMLPEHFILYKPRDIVSGDFYWTYKSDDYLYIAVADCTGHGVPGALMSMLGISMLNEIMKNISSTKTLDRLGPDKVLNHLREALMKALHQKGEQMEAKDGMDISLIKYDLNKRLLQFSGANNSILLVKKNSTPHEPILNNSDDYKLYTKDGITDAVLYKIKADRMPIGIYIKDDQEFSKKTLQMDRGDTIYLFTDGYVDQFGGETRRKFMARQFYDLLIEIQSSTMCEQHIVLDKCITEWRGSNDQIDDILVLGVRF